MTAGPRRPAAGARSRGPVQGPGPRRPGPSPPRGMVRWYPEEPSLHARDDRSPERAQCSARERGVLRGVHRGEPRRRLDEGRGGALRVRQHDHDPHLRRLEGERVRSDGLRAVPRGGRPTAPAQRRGGAPHQQALADRGAHPDERAASLLEHLEVSLRARGAPVRRWHRLRRHRSDRQRGDRASDTEARVHRAAGGGDRARLQQSPHHPAGVSLPGAGGSQLA